MKLRSVLEALDRHMLKILVAWYVTAEIAGSLVGSSLSKDVWEFIFSLPFLIATMTRSICVGRGWIVNEKYEPRTCSSPKLFAMLIMKTVVFVATLFGILILDAYAYLVTRSIVVHVLCCILYGVVVALLVNEISIVATKIIIGVAKISKVMSNRK